MRLSHKEGSLDLPHCYPSSCLATWSGTMLIQFFRELILGEGMKEGGLFQHVVFCRVFFKLD